MFLRPRLNDALDITCTTGATQSAMLFLVDGRWLHVLCSRRIPHDSCAILLSRVEHCSDPNRLSAENFKELFSKSFRIIQKLYKMGFFERKSRKTHHPKRSMVDHQPFRDRRKRCRTLRTDCKFLGRGFCHRNRLCFWGTLILGVGTPRLQSRTVSPKAGDEECHRRDCANTLTARVLRDPEGSHLI